MPTYTFNSTEQLQIITAYNQGSTVNWSPGNHIPFYSTMSTILSTDTGLGSPDANPEVLPVRIWFDGATKVNEGAGVFSTLIREYTQTQGELHWARRFTDTQDPSVISEMQEASNRVARKAQETLAGPSNWDLQTINQIASNDAIGVGEVLFNFVSGDTINPNTLLSPSGQNAAWSGTLLFSSFDDPDNPDVTVDETGRLISTGSSATQADTLDDWRNVIYAHHAYDNALSEAINEGASSLLSRPEFANLIQDIATSVEVCMLSGRCDSSISTFVKGQQAENAFAPVILYDEYNTLNLLKSAAIGEAFTEAQNSNESDNFTKNARSFFGLPGPQNQSIVATINTIDSLIENAKNGDNPSQKALFGLSPFTVTNSTVVSSNFKDRY